MMKLFQIETKHSAFIILLMLIRLFACLVVANALESPMLSIPDIMEGLDSHLETLTITIGERSVLYPENIRKTRDYIVSVHQEIGFQVHTEPYLFGNQMVENVVAIGSFGAHPSKRFLLGAHYDSVSGTVGADDNASAVAVQLETARQIAKLALKTDLNIQILFVSFALEEPPAYGTRYMGSRVFAKRLKKEKERLDGMICLEMVGYTCSEPGCQNYPFPLMLMNYPKEGRFIGVVGNTASRVLTKSITAAFQNNADLSVVKLTVPFNGWILPSVRLSDHSSFWDQGYPAVMITDSAFYRNPHYHLPSDTKETLDIRFMAELVESLVLFFISQK